MLADGEGMPLYQCGPYCSSTWIMFIQRDERVALPRSSLWSIMMAVVGNRTGQPPALHPGCEALAIFGTAWLTALPGSCA